MTNAAAVPPWDGKLASVETMFLNNKDAINFMKVISAWSHLYDDLIDDDKRIPPEFVHQVMWDVMVGLPLNQFYVANASMLAPIIATGILNWRAANAMEKAGSKEELHISHVTRYSINDLALMVMTLIGGTVHAAQYARDARLAYQRDTFEHYLSEHTHV